MAEYDSDSNIHSKSVIDDLKERLSENKSLNQHDDILSQEPLEAERIHDEQDDSPPKSYVARWSSSQYEQHDQNVYDEFDDDESDDELPIFADDVCKQIHQSTKEMEQLRDESHKKTNLHIQRVNIMKDHLQNIRQEIDHTNGIVAARKKEVETESHLIALGDKEQSLYDLESKHIEDSLNEERQRFKNMQNRILSANSEIEKLKIALNWNQEELEQWATAASKREEDNIALQKYTRSDDLKIKECILTIENLSKALVEKQTKFENESTETRMVQIQLDRTSEIFRKKHDERRNLVQQWQETVEKMRDRDNEINDVALRYEDARKEYNNQLNLLSAKKSELLVLEVNLITKLLALISNVCAVGISLELMTQFGGLFDYLLE